MALSTPKYTSPTISSAAAEKREEYKFGKGKYQQLLDYFKPGGAFLAGSRYRALQTARSSVPFGMGGTTRPMALSAGAEMSLQQQAGGMYANALQNWAQYSGNYVPIYSENYIPPSTFGPASAGYNRLTVPGAWGY